MEPEDSQKKNHDGVAHVELMSQGMISDNYDLIEAAVRASTGDSDETAAIAMLQLKTDQMGAWAVWVPDGESNKIGAVAVTEIGTYGLNRQTAVNIFSFYGEGISMAQWAAAFESMIAQLRQFGIKYVVAQTTNPRVSDIAQECGFEIRSFCVREL